MSEIDHKKIGQVYLIMKNQSCRNILSIIGKDSAKTYTELWQGFNEVSTQKIKSNHFAYYLDKLIDCYIIRKDKDTKTYYLTRMGVKILKMFKTFEAAYVKYDMNDVKADGKVKRYVVIEDRIN